MIKTNQLLAVIIFLNGLVALSGCGGGSQKQTNGSQEKATQNTEKQKKKSAKSDGAKKQKTAKNEKTVDKRGKGSPVAITVKTPGTTMQNMRYDVSVIKLNKGQTVQLTLKNIAPEDAAAMKHNFVVTKKQDAKTVANKGMKAGKDAGYLPENKDKILAHTKVVEQGKQTQIAFTLNKTGTYKFICTYPGHYPTMQGTIEVSA